MAEKFQSQKFWNIKQALKLWIWLQRPYIVVKWKVFYLYTLSKGPGFNPLLGFLKVWWKKIYWGRIFIYVYPETLGLKYDSLDNPVPKFQLFAKINFDAVCLIAQKTKKAIYLTGEKLSLQIWNFFHWMALCVQKDIIILYATLVLGTYIFT